jgi:precorrin-6B C5,15-methyltransferase / cobalt-precorrin-6B C5,C15-methyltransferase
MAEPVHIVGAVGGEVFGAASRAAIATADVVVGSTRHLARFASGPADRVELTGPLEPIVERVAAEHGAGRAVCVLASGDPGFFGIARLVVDRLGRGAVRIHPAPSSVALAFAAAGVSWDDALVVSAHGRPLAAGLAAVVAAPKVAVLTAPGQAPEALGRALLDAGCGPREVVVASRLGEDDEAVVGTDLTGLATGCFDPLSVVVLLQPDVAAAGPGLSWGRLEDEFAQRPGMITKAEVRAVALSKLALTRHAVLWDVGAGSGAVAVEAATLAPGLRAYAVERDATDAANIGVNAAAADVAVDVVVGAAPAVLERLPDPDRVFVGGGGIEVLHACWARLRPGGRLVATCVVLDHALAAFALLGSMVQVHVDRCVPIGDAGVRLEPLNPVFVCWGDKDDR